MKDMREGICEKLPEEVKQLRLEKKDLSNGKVMVEVQIEPKHYYRIISDYINIPIKGEYELMKTLLDLSKSKSYFERIQNALEAVKRKGYGVVTPEREEIVLDEPQVVKHGNKYGVKMKAEAPSIHLIKSYIETEIAPIVGSEQQAEDLIAYMKETAKEKEDGIWAANIFGKSIEQIVDDGIDAKISQMTDDCQMKLQEALQKIINDSNGGMICIII